MENKWDRKELSDMISSHDLYFHPTGYLVSGVERLNDLVWVGWKSSTFFFVVFFCFIFTHHQFVEMSWEEKRSKCQIVSRRRQLPDQYQFHHLHLFCYIHAKTRLLTKALVFRARYYTAWSLSTLFFFTRSLSLISLSFFTKFTCLFGNSSRLSIPSK